MVIMFNERQVELELTGWGDNGDGIEIASAVYTDTGEDVSDDDVNTIFDHWADEIYTEQYINCAARAYDDWKNQYDR